MKTNSISHSRRKLIAIDKNISDIMALRSTKNIKNFDRKALSRGKNFSSYHRSQPKKKTAVINLKNLLEAQSEKENQTQEVHHESSMDGIEETKEKFDSWVNGHLIIPQKLQEKNKYEIISSSIS